MADAAAAAANKKKTLIIAGAAALLVILLVVVFAARGKKDSEDAGDSKTTRTRSLARRGGRTARRRAESKGLVETEETPEQAKATEEIKPQIYEGEAEPIRSDPFVLQKPPPPPPPPPTPPVLPAVAPMPGGIRPSRDGRFFTTLRRTAGIMWNGEVYGLLQLGAETYIVRPGDTVREYTVSAITRDSIILYSPVLRRQIQVPLQGPRSRMPEQVVTGPSAEAYALGGETSIDLGIEEIEEVPEFEETLEWVEEGLIPALPEFPPE